MARSLTEIQNEIIADVNTELPDLSSSSQTALWRLWTFVVASAIYLHEVLWDLFKEELEEIAAEAKVGTAEWLQSKALVFQYSPTEPQVLEVVDFVPRYVTIDEGLRIIDVASVKQQTNRRVVVKVAKDDGSSGLIALDAMELSAFRSYIRAIQFAGTSVDVQSANADKLYIEMTVYYDGQFVQSVVSTNVKSAINNYIQNLEFDGLVYVNKFIDAIQAVDGVKDLKIDLLRARTDADPFGTINNNAFYNLSAGVNNRFYETGAGYIVLEDTAGETFDDKVTFTIA